MRKYTPEIAARAESVLSRMRELLPGATELVYDNYNALAIGFGPTGRPSGAVFSIALYPRWISLFFLHGAGLPDPHKLLKGSGKIVRHIVLQKGDELDDPAVRELMAEALKRASWSAGGPLPRARTTPASASARGSGPRASLAAAPGQIIIKAISAKQRPRRP